MTEVQSSPVSVPAVSEQAAESSTSRADLLIARMERLPFTKKHFGIGAVLFSATFFDGYSNLMLTSALPLIVISLHLPILQAGVLVSSAFWGQLIGAPFAGLVAERIGRRNVLLATTVIIGIPAFGAAAAQNLDQLIIARALQGIGLGAEMPVAAAMFNEFLRGRRRGLAVLLWESGFVWGGFVAPWLAIAFIYLFGHNGAWRAMFLFAGLAFFIVFFRLGRLFPESPRYLIQRGRLDQADKVVSGLEDSARKAGKTLPEPVVVAQPSTERPPFIKQLGELLVAPHRRRIIVIIVWIGLAYLFAYGFSPFIAELYVKIGGLPVGSAILLTLVSFCITTPWNYFHAATVDRFGRKFWYGLGPVYAAVILAIGALVVGVGHNHAWPVLFIIQVLTQFGGSYATGFYVYCPEQFPTRLRAWATGIGSAAIRGAGSIGPIVTALLVASAGGLGITYLFFALTFLVSGLAVLIFGPETKRQALEEIAP